MDEQRDIIPVLDGGHLLFYFLEAIRKKPLKEKTENMLFINKWDIKHVQKKNNTKKE